MLANYNNIEMFISTQVYKKVGKVPIYDFLSSVLQQLSFFFSSAHQITISHAKYEYQKQTELVQELRQRLQNQKILEQFRQNYPDSPSGKILLYKRFINRIDQLIFPIKHKLSKSNFQSTILQAQISRMEIALSGFQQNAKIVNIIQTILSSFKKFLKNIKNLNRCQCLDIQTKQDYILKDRYTKQSIIETKETSAHSSSEKDGVSSANNLKNFKTNKKFDQIKLLDLDIGYYRSCYFQSKYDPDFYKQYLERNKRTKQSIIAYSKSYSVYLVEKQKRRQRRNKKRSVSIKKSIKQKNRETKIFIQEKSVSTTFHHRNALSSANRRNVSINSPIPLKNQIKSKQYFESQPTKPLFELKSILVSAQDLRIGNLDQPGSVGYTNAFKDFRERRKKLYKINDNQKKTPAII